MKGVSLTVREIGLNGQLGNWVSGVKGTKEQEEGLGLEDDGEAERYVTG